MLSANKFNSPVSTQASLSQEHTDTLVFIGAFEAAQEYIKDNEASH